MQRYFVDINKDNIIFSSDDIHHITHVMRMKVGEKIEAVNNGLVYLLEISSINPFVTRIIDSKKEDVELNKHITLFFALSKGDKIDFVIQKATELGVHRIVLFKSKRCVTNFDNKDFLKKVVRYQKIAKEASEQCHRLMIPDIEGVIELKDIDKYLEDINYVAYEKEAGSTEESFNYPEDVKGISVMIGSEGGFELEEINFLKEKGFKSISLGKRILRCETAVTYALSVLAYKLEK